MLSFIKDLWAKVTQSKPVAEVPYKIETPSLSETTQSPSIEPQKCGCGRSTTGFCVGLHRLTADEWAVHADNPQRAASAPVVSAEKPTKKTRKVKAASQEEKAWPFEQPKVPKMKVVKADKPKTPRKKKSD